MKKWFYKKECGKEILVKCIDENNNYSVASNLDPEPEGYINHSWDEDAGDWQEITESEAEEILNP